MGTSEVFSFFLFFFFLVMILTNITVLANDCSISSNNLCSPYELVPRFPFRIKDQLNDSCGYPGFSLTCKKFDNLYGTKTVLELPLSGEFVGEFVVKEIDYVKQEIRLEDPDNCLAKRLLDLNLSNSPFKSVYYQNYTFLNCTRQILFGSTWTYIIGCLSTGNGYVLATTSMNPNYPMTPPLEYCEVIKTVSVPVRFPVQFPFQFLVDYGSDFLAYGSKLTLSWDKPDCRYCEAQDQECRLRNTTSHETRCFRKKGLKARAISSISIGIGLPVLVGIIFCVVFYTRVCSDDDVHQTSNVELSNAISSQPIIPVISLNESAIDSYPKIVLGESRRLPKPDDNICPICLSEYLPKEILKIIPECNHNFHTDCIDQWLYTNMTCPVCRNSPT